MQAERPLVVLAFARAGWSLMLPRGAWGKAPEVGWAFAGRRILPP